ncbi:MAG TPA: DUF1499 domain-containing protein [Vicinamibacteria bacterium]|jgi:uncharacterized protein (DUF1499 family)|nr:DUF1499 domain-containing protein [Vicinamibacteria bacterium]
MARKLLLLVLVLGGLGLSLGWPRLNDVETGRTPEYPDLRVRDYRAGVETVSKAVQDALRTLPRWTFVAAGSGPGGAEVQAIHETRVLHFKDDVTIRISSKGGRTRVSVRSRSRVGKWDFGQNARNVRELLSSLDAAVS